MADLCRKASCPQTVEPGAVYCREHATENRWPDRKLRAALYSAMSDATEDVYRKARRAGHTHDEIQAAHVLACNDLMATDIEPPPQV